jgi:tetratricopeptide (TPR) repeat protein
VSQIFEALRRRQEQDQREGSSRRTAQADAVLATMGFASERQRSPRERYAPLLLGLLLVVVGWLGWRWYAGAETHPMAQMRPAAPAPVTPAESPRSVPAQPPVPGIQQQAARGTIPPNASSAPAAPNATSAPDVPNATKPARASKPANSANRDPFPLALYYHRAGDFENALMYYRAVLQKNELNQSAHNNLGVLYRDKGLFEEAVRHFQRALLIDGRYLTARNNLGVALLGLGRLDEAAAEFRRVLAADPRQVDAMVNLALVEKAGGRPGVAIETLIRAITVDPRSAAAHYNLAVLYEQSGEMGRAVEHYRTFLDHAGSQHAARAPEVRARLAELDRRAAR